MHDYLQTRKTTFNTRRRIQRNATYQVPRKQKKTEREIPEKSLLYLSYIFVKRTPLKRKTGLKRTAWGKNGSVKPRMGSRLRVVGQSTSTDLKKEIQAVLRQIVIKRDGGCFLRHYENQINPQYKKCGGYRKDGNLILQAEHLHSRSNAISFSDSRLVVCVCQRHHIYYKPQHSAEYNQLSEDFIGANKAVKFAFIRSMKRCVEALPFRRLQAKVDTRFETGQIFLEKLGFEKEGICRKFDKQLNDYFYYALLKE